MSTDRDRLEQLRRWKLAASWAPVAWFPVVVFALSVEQPLVAATLGLAGAVFAGAARAAVWSARCPRCGESFRARPGGFRRIWDEASCLACGVSLFELRRAGGERD
ncbi:hypothetical protein K2X89_01125 [Myxococcota bacterium]|nr:hypothetical protein [Myxococcota bacterium]